jgi:hypothetical protein
MVITRPTLRARDGMLLYLWISIFMLIIDRGAWKTAG